MIDQVMERFPHFLPKIIESVTSKLIELGQARADKESFLPLIENLCRYICHTEDSVLTSYRVIEPLNQAGLKDFGLWPTLYKILEPLEVASSKLKPLEVASINLRPPPKFSLRVCHLCKGTGRCCYCNGRGTIDIHRFCLFFKGTDICSCVWRKR